MATKKIKKSEKKEEVFYYKTIKTFEDACKKVGVKPTDLPDVSMIPEEFRSAIINCYKLYIIFKAINNGWEADYSNSNQYKYWPWFWVLSSGFGFVVSCYICDGTGAAVGSRLCTDTSEKAKYIAVTFSEEYKEFFLKRK